MMCFHCLQNPFISNSAGARETKDADIRRSYAPVRTARVWANMLEMLQEYCS
jgi:hypothetical protein